MLKSEWDMTGKFGKVSVADIHHDLECLKLALKHQYVAYDYYHQRSIDLIQAVDALKAK